MLIYRNPRQYNHLSRYIPYYQIVDTDLNCTYLESFNNINVSKSNATFHIVEANEENRLDIISQKYYNTPTLYWLIAAANELIDPMIVSQGTVLTIPSYESMFATGGPLSPQ